MRDAYADQLDAIRGDLLTMTKLVETAVSHATAALLDGDAAVAEKVISADVAIAALRVSIEDNSFELLSLQNPVAGDLRMLVASDWKLGVEPAVDIALLGRYFERIADHAVSIARRVVFLVTGEQPTYLN